MLDREDLQAVGGYAVDDTVRTLEQFPDLIVAKGCQARSASWSCHKPIDPTQDALDQGKRSLTGL